MSSFDLTNNAWVEIAGEEIGSVLQKKGIPVAALKYSLLEPVDDTGSFFISHTDTSIAPSVDSRKLWAKAVSDPVVMTVYHLATLGA